MAKGPRGKAAKAAATAMRANDRATARSPQPRRPDVKGRSRGHSTLRKTRRAVVLLSGGLDSTTAAAWAQAEGFDLVALSFDYGQRHKKELASAKRVAKSLGILDHRILLLPIGKLGGSALTDRMIAVPDAPKAAAIGASIPVTYVPARNTIFLSFALGVAEVTGSAAIVIGANALDYSGYPDCRPEFLAAFERMANLATKAGAEGQTVKLLAPLLQMGKADIVRLAHRLQAPIAATWSCYRGGTRPCGRCESCMLRAKGFSEAGLVDAAVAK